MVSCRNSEAWNSFIDYSKELLRLQPHTVFYKIIIDVNIILKNLCFNLIKMMQFARYFCIELQIASTFLSLLVIHIPAVSAQPKIGGFAGAILQGDFDGAADMTRKEVKRRTDACISKGVNGCIDDMRTGVKDGAQTGAAALSCYEGNIAACADAGRQLYDNNPRIFGTSRSRHENPAGTYSDNPMPSQRYHQRMPNIFAPSPYGRAEYGQPSSTENPERMPHRNALSGTRQSGYAEPYPTGYQLPLPSGYDPNVLQKPNSSYYQQVPLGYPPKPYFNPSP